MSISVGVGKKECGYNPTKQSWLSLFYSSSLLLKPFNDFLYIYLFPHYLLVPICTLQHGYILFSTWELVDFFFFMIRTSCICVVSRSVVVNILMNIVPVNYFDYCYFASKEAALS